MIPFFERYNNIPKQEIKQLQEEVEQLQSDDDYVKGLALDNKRDISKIKDLLLSYEESKKGLFLLVQVQEERIVELERMVEALDKGMKYLLK